MEIIIQISGQAMSVEVSIGVYAYLDQADHKAYFSLDCEDGIENDAIGWEQPSPEELFIQAEEQAHAELFLLRLKQALNCLTPIQANRIYARFFLGKRYVEIARVESVSSGVIGRSISGAVDRLRRYFKQQKWEDFYL